ncbi:MAG: deoxyguanosinetriphosphate triphosphohydrolase [Sphingomonadaceae bacterium]
MARAAYATDPSQSRGRRHPEPESALRTPFARDRDRLIHSTAFRRLRYKTQVFVAPDGDHFRVRLTHSLEVAQIARTLARVLALDEDLAEVVALAHDLGHPPFGHSGEEALTRAMAPFGGFDHNGHAVRILTLIENRTPEHDGLNPSWEVLEGIAKHNGPVSSPGWALAEADADFPLDLESHAGLEAQLAALADDIAYSAHDLDDGLRADLFDLDAVTAEVPLVDGLWRDVLRRWPNEARRSRLRPQLVRDLIGVMVDDLLAETRRRLAEQRPGSVAEIRAAGRPTAQFTAGLTADLAPLRAFLRRAMYFHPSVQRIRGPAERIVEELFQLFEADPARLPARWAEAVAARPEGPWPARIAGDFIAGMTDRYAIRKHRELTGTSPLPPDASQF